MTAGGGSPLVGTPARYLSVGRSQDHDFQPLWEFLQDQTSPTPWTSFATVSEFLRQATEHRSVWELAVFWQCWSDEYSSDDVAALLRALPLCRVICITGPWCESDQRTRRTWPPALVVPWWRASLRLDAELDGLQNFPDQLAPPWTATREEVWLWEQGRSASPAARNLVRAMDDGAGCPNPG